MRMCDSAGSIHTQSVASVIWVVPIGWLTFQSCTVSGLTGMVDGSTASMFPPPVSQICGNSCGGVWSSCLW